MDEFFQFKFNRCFAVISAFRRLIAFSAAYLLVSILNISNFDFAFSELGESYYFQFEIFTWTWIHAIECTSSSEPSRRAIRGYLIIGMSEWEIYIFRLAKTIRLLLNFSFHIPHRFAGTEWTLSRFSYSFEFVVVGETRNFEICVLNDSTVGWAWACACYIWILWFVSDLSAFGVRVTSSEEWCEIAEIWKFYNFFFSSRFYCSPNRLLVFWCSM